MDSLSPSSDGPRCWSKLHTDLLHMIFERLGFADFQRANSVCSSWRSASRQSAPTNQIPWLILFPEKGEDYCLLFNPEEKDRMYRIQDLDVNFANSHCLAISGSWLFIRDPRYNFYILNLFTRERIDMPPVESQLGMLKIERTTNDMFLVKLTDEDDRRARDLNFHWPLFWIDEQTRDYVVTGLIDSDFGSILIYSKNGDSVWKQIKRTEPYDLLLDMVCRDHKIYLYNWSRNVKVLDLSGGSPRQIFETHGNYVYLCNYSFIPYLDDEEWPIKKTHLVVTVTGEFLRVKSIVMSNSDVWTFRVYKMDSSNREWEKITSLGDEAILLDQGITVLANAIEGLNRNSIYFNGDRDESGFRVWSEKDVFIFNLDTNEVERPHRSICSSIQSPDARWFVPNINRK